jgi:hypothetical protein
VPLAHACNPSYSGGSRFEVSPGQIVRETLSQKYPTQKRAGKVAQVVERLPSKYEALSLNPNTTKKKKNKKKPKNISMQTS